MSIDQSSYIYTKLKGETLDPELLIFPQISRINKYIIGSGSNANWRSSKDTSMQIDEMFDTHLAEVLAVKEELMRLGVTEWVVHITIMDSYQGNFELSKSQVQTLALLEAAVAITIVYQRLD